MKYRLQINGLPPRNTAHYMKVYTAKKQWATLLNYLAIEAKLPKAVEGEYRRISIIFQSPGVKRDKDNLHTLCKVPLDALKRAGLIHDDSPKYIGLEVDDVSGKPTQTIIWVETIDDQIAGAA